MGTLRKRVSLKTLAHKVLAGNSRGSSEETRARSGGNLSLSVAPREFPPGSAGSNLARSTQKAHDRDCNPLPESPPSGPEIRTFNQEDLDLIRSGGRVAVWSEVLSEWLWWVRDEDARQQLLSEGCVAAIYTLGELALVAGWDSNALNEIHATKKLLGGTVENPQE